ncbi:MAG: FkbM family methyltransferase [Arcobacter sp.]|uniref:FkbM family methyltransferase n=1 Tax=Arcobacter sp. TaxID=1872629 RepID=UPI003C78578B
MYIGKSIEEYGEFSIHEANLFEKTCKEGDIVFEVGSNIGTHTQVLSQIVTNKGRVIAFEPQRLAFQTLCANLAINSITNVDAYNQAVGQKIDKINVPDLDYSKSNNFGGISLQNIENGKEVYQRTLDEFIDKVSAFDFLKIDVEGMEIDVLLGAKKIVSKFKPIIYLENDRQEKSEKLINLMWSMGYKLYWHLPPLYNLDNFFNNDNNIFHNIVSVNMLCIHESVKYDFDLNEFNLTEITDALYHPMSQRKLEKQKEYNDKLKESASAYKNKDYEKALNIISYLIEKGYKTAEVYNNLGLLYSKLQKWQESVDSYQISLRLDPNYLNSYFNFAALLKGLKRYKDALQVYVMGVRKYPKDFNLHNNIGMVYETLGEDNNAIEAYKNAVRVNPKFAKAINNIAVILYKQKRYKESSDMFELALKTDPNYVEVYSNLGAALNRQKRYDESIKALETSIEKLPKSAGAYTNLGNVYNKLFEYKKAEELHKKSIKLEPKGSNAYANLASSLKNQGLVKKAIESYRKAITHEPNFVNAHFDLSTALLTLGEFEEGFLEYEWRFKKDEMLPHIVKYKEIFSKPMLTKNSKAKDKIVLIHSEQGFGDSIMFARFIPQIKEKFSCKIIFKARDELVELLKNNCDIDEVYYRSKPTPKFDFHLPIMSAAFVLGIKDYKDFSSSAYINNLEEDKTLAIEKQNKKYNIGICWSASITGESYEGKVFDLKYFEPLINSENFNIYSLQVGDGKSDIEKNDFTNKIIDITDSLTDFKKTAIFAKELDLVITSDTSVAHLCGAIGVKTWTLLQKFPDWRWENKGEKSYMYDSMKLIRQKHDRNWETVFQALFDKIQKEFKVKL